MGRSRNLGIARKLACLAALAAAALLGTGLAPARAALHSVRIASGLSQPMFVTAPAGDPRLFIVERAGVVKILSNGTLLPTPFLDITGLVNTTSAYGCFGLAFAPDYATSGLFYVYYVNLAEESVVARYQVSGNPDVANPVGESVIEIPQTYGDHNGGTIAFGPSDGYLYLAPGDGGGGPYDPYEKSQDPQELLGKMLRIDVSGGLGTTYSIPGDNPFVGNPGVRDEIWAFGLRNPFRWSFDRATGDLWIADVGQEAREEIDLEPAGDPGGRNYGWDVMEGTLCVGYDPAPAPPCNDPSLTLPLFEYGHDSDPNCSGSITGGYVHRGPRSPSLQGLYVFGDYCRNALWTLDPTTLDLVERTADLSPSIDGHSIDEIVGFGEDGLGELYVVDAGGEVFRIEAPFEVPALPPAGYAILAAMLAAAAHRRLAVRAG